MNSTEIITYKITTDETGGLAVEIAGSFAADFAQSDLATEANVAAALVELTGIEGNWSADTIAADAPDFQASRIDEIAVEWDESESYVTAVYLDCVA